jgi:pyridoxamine 5'-phosphate oxidase
MEPSVSVANLRKEYTLNGLHRQDLCADPFEQFKRWFDESVRTGGSREPNAMTLATSSQEGQPSARVVLLKGFDERGFVFFTNYESRKGEQLAQNPRAALNFHWPWLERQIQIEGSVSQVTRAESEEYFNKRPLGSRLGAMVSRQSAVIDSRRSLEEGLALLQGQFDASTPPPTPASWGGYRLQPNWIEFWQGRENRLHDRFLYRLQADRSWRIDRLGP